MRVLAIAGSLRAGSHNRALLRAAATALPPGVELVHWDRLGELPHFDEDVDRAGGGGAVVDDLRAALAGADALLVATPEYNGGPPGVLKNALDWASRPWPDHALRALPAAVVGASTGLFGAVWAQEDARKALRTAGADVLDDELPVGQADAAFAPDGSLVDLEQAERLRTVALRLVEHATARSAAAAA